MGFANDNIGLVGGGALARGQICDAATKRPWWAVEVAVGVFVVGTTEGGGVKFTDHCHKGSSLFRLSPLERKWNHLMRELDKSDPGDWEVLGLIGRGYTNSIYKLYLKLNSGRWWILEGTAQQMHGSPGKPRDVDFVSGDLTALKDIECHPDRDAIVKLLELFSKKWNW